MNNEEIKEERKDRWGNIINWDTSGATNTKDDKEVLDYINKLKNEQTENNEEIEELETI